ncbi:radical SAM protein [Paenibacillus silvae]|uniref:radical SAM protein n=1 Tax=Paenibacillus TaxID=44249 RepID=UPI001C1050F3|nr:MULTISPECIES: radical SAM protein [Paenibacillus]MBU5352726.1 radical SAM protein [Paenibacillus barcinonensis]MDM5281165.1 radical SAM protein [Paenibacillus silvae]
MITFLSKPLLFKSENAQYCFDNSTRIVIPVHQEEKEFLLRVDCGTQVEKSYFVENNLKSLLAKIIKYNLFQTNFQMPYIDEAYIVNKLEKEGIAHLCLIVTDSCNLRCKYCIYSDHYYLTKGYSNKFMDSSTATRAVDYFMNVNLQSIQNNPNMGISLGFYGGEPLLNWNLVKEVVEYVRDNYPVIFKHVSFSITTNASLLTESKIRYMLENRFSISVSLDGDRENHDRNRVTLKNRGTFDLVFKKINLLETIYKEYTDKGDTIFPYGILVTFDNLTHFKRLDDFFKENKNIDIRIQRVNRVSDLNTEYYKERSQSDQSHLDQREQFIRELIESSKNKNFELEATNFSKTILKSIIFEPMMNLAYNDNLMRGGCIPGIHKLAVDADGKFHMCEKINPHYPVGDVNTGLDFSRQAKYMNQFFETLSECNNCNLKNICNLCYVTTEKNGSGFEIKEDYCSNFRKGILNSLSHYYSIMENNPNLFKEIRE